ncbi:hypothetical protein Gorai_006918 [Gossypium raimondii]|uniref:Uncharacterized protein n=1 Tax=Gossypium raimondii TaxID=29730 RepID=A0A7J8Q718_GOSRA|nr:hypothetical protein [Gossypium raimondii]
MEGGNHLLILGLSLSRVLIFQIVQLDRDLRRLLHRNQINFPKMVLDSWEGWEVLRQWLRLGSGISHCLQPLVVLFHLCLTFKCMDFLMRLCLVMLLGFRMGFQIYIMVVMLMDIITTITTTIIVSVLHKASRTII